MMQIMYFTDPPADPPATEEDEPRDEPLGREPYWAPAYCDP